MRMNYEKQPETAGFKPDSTQVKMLIVAYTGKPEPGLFISSNLMKRGRLIQEGYLEYKILDGLPVERLCITQKGLIFLNTSGLVQHLKKREDHGATEN